MGSRKSNAKCLTVTDTYKLILGNRPWLGIRHSICSYKHLWFKFELNHLVNFMPNTIHSKLTALVRVTA